MGAGSVGSGLWSKQAPLHPHLAQGQQGIIGEVADLRGDLARVLTSLLAVTLEDYVLPSPAIANNIMVVTATVVAAVSYSYKQLTGVLASGKISPPRNVEVVTAGATATHAPTSFTIAGIDVNGNAISETISGTAGGASTYAGVKCFAQVTNVSAPAATGTDATFSVGTGAVIGLSSVPKRRQNAAVGTLRSEIYDAGVVTNGALTVPATNPPNGAYVPNTGPATAHTATLVGTVDLTAPGTFGAGGTLSDAGGNDLIFKMVVNGATASLTLNGTTNVATQAAFLAAIQATWQVTASISVATGFLTVTDTLTGDAYDIVVPSDITNTADAVVGIGGAGGTSDLGLGHNYTIEYEIDAAQQSTGPSLGAPGPIVPPPGSGAPKI